MGDVTSGDPPARPTITGPSGLALDHDTSAFLCGHHSLDEWLKNTALKSEGRTARTYVVCEGNAVVGYYSLATGSVVHLGAPRKLRQNAPDPIPIAIIGRLAVAKHRAGQGIGGGMLRDALKRVVQISHSIGCRAVLVHPIDGDAQSFYERYQFQPFPAGAKTMFLTVESITAAIDV